MKKSIPLVAGALAAGLVLSACGSSDNATTSPSAAPSSSTAGASSPASGAASESSPAASGAPAESSSAGESSAPAGGGEQLAATTIKILAPSYGDTSQADWEKIIAGFKAIQPNVTVELQIEAWEGFTDKVNARIQAGDAPDILNDNNFAQAVTDQLLYPIDEILSPEVLAGIEPALLKNGQGADGKQWVAPDIATSRLLTYNTAIFEQAGIAAAPKTWDEMLDAAKKIAALGNGIAGYGMPLGKEEAQAESTVWVWGAGGDWAGADGKLVANSEAAIEGFTEMKKFIDAKATQANPAASNRQDVADLFNQGKVGMMVSHPGLLATTRKDFPDVKYATAPIPSKDGSGVAYGVTDFILAFNNGDDARKAATSAFLNYFYSTDVYDGWYKGTGLLPVTTAGIAAAVASDKDNAPFLEALKTVKFTPTGNPEWTGLQNALQSTAGTIQDGDPKTVLDTIQQQMLAVG